MTPRSLLASKLIFAMVPPNKMAAPSKEMNGQNGLVFFVVVVYDDVAEDKVCLRPVYTSSEFRR